MTDQGPPGAQLHKKASTVPESFICPLTGEVMREPVIDPEGNSYERRAILDWLARNPTSPITRTPLQPSDLVPNRALHDAITASNSAAKVPVPASIAPAALNPPAAVPCASSRFAVSATCFRDVACVHIGTPEQGPRARVSLVCAIDVSGSMGVEATVVTAGGEREGHGLSVMDIAKHAVRTTVNSLSPGDSFGLVAYSTQARVVLPLTPMTPEGRERAEAALAQLVPEGSTNLWDGLVKSLDLLGVLEAGRVGACWLLTDGLPTVEPPRGHVPMLRRYREQHGGSLGCTVSTFGFGYQLNSALLCELAIEGRGMYAFIPDSNFVGTTFTHAAANLFTTLETSCSLILTPLHGTKLVSASSEFFVEEDTTASGGSLKLSIGSLQYGPGRDIVFRLAVSDQLPGNVPFLSVRLRHGRCGINDELASLDAVCRLAVPDPELEVQLCRLAAVSQIRAAMRSVCKGSATPNCDVSRAKDIVQALVKTLADCPAAGDLRISTISEDVAGQVVEAVARSDWYSRWGQHYLPSLALAHLHQVTNNFKDPGVQQYGGRMFAAIRDEIDDMFVRLPPPVPSVPPAPAAAFVGSSRRAAPTSNMANPRFSMSSYNRRDNPCFGSNCRALMADGSTKPMSRLAKGDLLSHGELICVVKTLCDEDGTELVAIPGGPLVTPWHPVRVDGRWTFPADLSISKRVRVDSVYSLVVKGGGSVVVDGTEAATLGHGIKGDIREHSYWGTSRVLEDLSCMRGWTDGLVVLQPGCVVRDASGAVCSLKQRPSEQ